MIEKPAKYLDKVLSILANDFDNYFDIHHIQSKLTPISFFGEKPNEGKVIFAEDLLLDLRNALSYLISENLVLKNPGNLNEYTLTFKGYIKIKTKGFAAEIKEKSINQVLQRLAWTLPIIISVLALLVALLKNNDTFDTKQKINSKIHHCCEKLSTRN